MEPCAASVVADEVDGAAVAGEATNSAFAVVAVCWGPNVAAVAIVVA